MNHRAAPGIVRDSIVSYLSSAESASVAEIREAVIAQIGVVPPSSVRSYLNINTPEIFERTARGNYKLRHRKISTAAAPMTAFTFLARDSDRSTLWARRIHR